MKIRSCCGVWDEEMVSPVSTLSADYMLSDFIVKKDIGEGYSQCVPIPEFGTMRPSGCIRCVRVCHDVLLGKK